MPLRDCLHSADAFNYVCGQFIKKIIKKFYVKPSVKMSDACEAYFAMLVQDQVLPGVKYCTILTYL